MTTVVSFVYIHVVLLRKLRTPQNIIYKPLIATQAGIDTNINDKYFLYFFQNTVYKENPHN